MPRVVYVGTDERGDVYQLVDEGGDVIEWAVPINGDPAAAIEGTIQNLGKPSIMTIAQAEPPPVPSVPNEEFSEVFSESPPPVPVSPPVIVSTPEPSALPVPSEPVPEIPPEIPPDDMTPSEEYGAVMNFSTDSRHVYVGTDSRGDVYQLVDEGGNVIEWAVPVNGGSSDIIPGTVQNLGPASNMTVAQGPAYVPPVGSGVTASPVITPGIQGGIQGDDRHVYVGTDNRGDVWQLVDEGGNVIEWAVPVNASSGEVIESTVRNLGPASPMSVAQGPAYVPPTPAPASNVIATGIPGGTNSNPNPAPVGSGNPVQGDPRHKYVGRDSRGDVWQIFDGTNVIEWAVKPGDNSSNIISGSAKNLGAPSSMTVAQNDGTPVGGKLQPTQAFGNNAEAGGGTALTLILGLATLAVKLI